MFLVSEIPLPEENALEKLRPLLDRLLNRCVEMVTPTGEAIPDGMVLKEAGLHATPLLTVVYKRAFGEGGCDPSTQVSFSVREFLALNQVHDSHVFRTSIDPVLRSHPSWRCIVTRLSSLAPVLVYPFLVSSSPTGSSFSE